MKLFATICLIVLITLCSTQSSNAQANQVKNDGEGEGDGSVDSKSFINGINNLFKPMRDETQSSSTSKPKLKAPTIPTDQTVLPDKDNGQVHKLPPKTHPTVGQGLYPRPYKTRPTNMPDDWNDDLEGDLINIRPSDNRHEPNTIQEWMNENRPVSALKKPVRYPIEERQKERPTQRLNDLKPKPNTVRPSSIRPSFVPAPWDKPHDSKPMASRPDEEHDPWIIPNRPKKSSTPNSKPKSTIKPDSDETNEETKETKSRNKPNMNRPESRPPGIYWEHSKPESFPKPPNPHSEPVYGAPAYSPVYKPEVPIKPNTNLPPWWNSPPALPEFEPEIDGEINGWGGNVFGDNSGNGIGGSGDINGIGGAVIGSNSGNGDGGVGNLNGLGGNIIDHNGANGVGGVGNDNGQGGFIIGNNSGNGKGGIGENNGIGGNKGGKNSANGTGGFGNNNGKGGILIGHGSGNGIGGVNHNNSPSHQ